MQDLLAIAVWGTLGLVLGLGPPAAILWMWRRWGGRYRLGLLAAFLLVVVFVLTGAAGATVGLIEVLALSRPGGLGIFPGGGHGPAEHVAYCYWVAGSRSVLAAVVLALAWVPAVLLVWRRLHPDSFHRVTTPKPGPGLSFVEQDYRDGVAEPGATPTPQRPDSG